MSRNQMERLGTVERFKSTEEAAAAGFVRCSREEAFLIANNVVNKWPDKSDTRSLRLGFAPVAFAAAATPFILMRKLYALHKVRGFGRWSMAYAMPAAVVPFSTSTIFMLMAKEDILLGLTPCFICLQTRTTGQIMAGTFAGTALTLLGGYASLQNNKVNLDWYQKATIPQWTYRMLQKTAPIVGASMLVQMALISGILYHEQKSWFKINERQ